MVEMTKRNNRDPYQIIRNIPAAKYCKMTRFGYLNLSTLAREVRKIQMTKLLKSMKRQKKCWRGKSRRSLII